jgi:DNA-binding LytR/AlgR family response regulator
VTNSATGGTSGVEIRALLIGWLILTAVTACVMVLNVMTVQADTFGIAVWEPWAWESTSAIMVVLAAWLPGLAVQTAGRGKVRILATHLAALLAFSSIHVFGMMAMRHGLYSLAHETYSRNAVESFVYEFRKDLVTYGLFAAAYWIVLREQRRRADPKPASTTFDIRDGGRLIRVATRDILAARSAENYVEFALADGRRPLMRATLKDIEARLTPLGFVRIHRSWVVNQNQVTGLKSQGSGDWLIELGATIAPLSRRYTHELARLASRE